MPKISFLVGIDEVGRGPLAGPVSVGAFAVGLSEENLIPNDLKNSKALSSTRREEWFVYFDGLAKEGKVRYAVTSVSNQVIDNFGIVYSIRRALASALNKLEIDPAYAQVFLDGGLRAPGKYKAQETIVKGDEKIPVIAAASIMAKVSRDRRLLRLSKLYPEYGFERHKGYGTRSHYEALRKHGLCEIHRRTYLANLL